MPKNNPVIVNFNRCDSHVIIVVRSCLEGHKKRDLKAACWLAPPFPRPLHKAGSFCKVWTALTPFLTQAYPVSGLIQG